jgi:hypothetical protein
MNVSEARKILQKPVFGDPNCLEAKRVIDEDAEMASLRSLLNGKKIECWCCRGRGHLMCACGCLDRYHPCHTCKAQNKLTLEMPLLCDLTIHQLRDIAKDLGIIYMSTAAQ